MEPDKTASADKTEGKPGAPGRSDVREALEWLDAHPELEELLGAPPAGAKATCLAIRVHSLADQIYGLEDDSGWQWHWNATEGRQIAEARNAPVMAFRPGDHGIDREHLMTRYPSLNEEHARSRDLSQPLLFVPFKGKSQLIDGWHRLLKAVLEGVEELPAIHLTQDEADKCLLMVLPPGRGRPLDEP